MPRTRSSAPSEPPPQSASTSPSESDRQTKQPLMPIKPSKTFILPSTVSPEARFLTLPNPQTCEPTRYFFCPKQGVYEFTSITSTSSSPRSILFAHNSPASNPTKTPDDISDTTSTQPEEPAHPPSSISQNAAIHIATPLDFIFFLIPLLTTAKATLYQPLDDVIDSIQDELAPHLRYVLYNETFRDTLHARAAAICDAVEAGDERLFRFSEKKLLLELVTKAERVLAVNGDKLPPSLEEKFVRSALAMPLMGVKRDTSSTVKVEVVVPSGGGENKENELESKKNALNAEEAQDDTACAVTSSVTVDTEETLHEESSTPDGVAELLRLSTALTFIKESYLSKELAARVDEMLAAPDTPKNFQPMREHLELIAQLRKEALAARSLGDFSRKRSAEDEEAAETRAEKKKRQEEEEKKKKAGESRGVRDLKKVNTTGMKKMSDFFGKAAAKKKKT